MFVQSHQASSWWSLEFNPGQILRCLVSYVQALPSAGRAVDLGEAGEFRNKTGQSGLKALTWGQRTSVIRTTWRSSSLAPLPLQEQGR